MGFLRLLPGHAKLLLWSALLLNVAKFSVTPFLAVYLTQILRLSAWQAGTILSTSLMVNYALPVVLGAVTDRLGYRPAMAMGCGSIAVGFTILVLSETFPLLVSAAFFIGLGGALYDPALRAALGHLSENRRKRAFTFLNQALNGGALLGAVVGGWLIALFNEKSPLAIGAFLSLFLAVSYLFFGTKLPRGSHSARIFQSMRNVLANRRFLWFTLTMTLFWMMYAQLTVAFPMQMFQITQESQWSGLIVIVNGASAFVLMFFIRRRLERTDPLRLIQIGFMIAAAGLAVVPLQPSVAWVILCVGIFTIGETFALPGMDIAVAEFSRYRNTAAYYGIFELSSALGGTLGSYMGTGWMEQWRATCLPWILLGLPGIAGCLLMTLFRRYNKTVPTPGKTREGESSAPAME